MALILPLAASNDRETQLPVDLNDNHATPPVAPDGEDIGREASPVSSESSDTDRQILPGLGAFVVFSIDPVASLDADVLDDPEAIAACNKLVNKKYVALADRNGFYNPWEPYNECIAQLILQGEPRSSPECGMEPSMSVPIIPMTIQDHPSGRAPLKPSNPLPWKDCYISSFFVVTVRSPTLFTQEPIQCMLDTKELTRRLILIGKDVQQKRNADRREAAAQIPVQSASLPDEVTSDSGPIRSADKSSDEDDDPADRVAGLRSAPSMHASETESESHRSYSTRGGGDGDEDSFDALFSEKLAPQGMITVHFSHDLSTVKQLHPPEEYYEEVNAIKRIEEESRARKARAIKLAQDRDTAAYDDRTLDLLIEKEAEAAPPIVEAEPVVKPENIAIEGKAETQISDVQPKGDEAPQPAEHSALPARNPAEAVTEISEETSPNPSVSYNFRSKLTRVWAKLKNGGKTISRHVARLSCSSHSLP